MIDQRDLSEGTLLFQDDYFTSPSYFEFDEYNEVIITFCASKQYKQHIGVIQSEYKVWRQRDYSFLYSISDERIQEVRVGSMCSYELSDRKGMVLVAQEAHFIPTGDLLVMPIMVLALYTGEIIYRANFFLHSTNEVEFLEVFEEYIFIKQRDHRLVIYSVATRKHPSISRWFRIES